MKEQNDNNKQTDINIEITEGCTAYSYTINGIEWSDLTDPDSEYYTEKQNGLIDYAFTKLYNELVDQYDIPNFLLDCMWDNDNYNDNCEQIPCTQYMFTQMVKANRNTVVEHDDYVCECCGDTVTTYRLKL